MPYYRAYAMDTSGSASGPAYHLICSCDDEAIEPILFQREALADLLKEEGFEVIECTTAEFAELIIASTGAELQALITDHKLAGAMSGSQLAQYARCRHPHLNIVIISGSAVKPLPVNSTFPQKPFTAAQLLEAVRD